MEYVNLKEMTWKEADVRMKEARAVILPLGSTEQHGYHMTIDTDNIVAGHVAGLLCGAAGIELRTGLVRQGFSGHNIPKRENLHISHQGYCGESGEEV